MTETATARRFDLVQKLVLAIIVLGLLHHLDHVGRVDHSSWPARPELGPFTFTLLIYPVLVWMFSPGTAAGRGSSAWASSRCSRCSRTP